MCTQHRFVQTYPGNETRCLSNQITTASLRVVILAGGGAFHRVFPPFFFLFIGGGDSLLEQFFSKKLRESNETNATCLWVHSAKSRLFRGFELYFLIVIVKLNLSINWNHRAKCAAGYAFKRVRSNAVFIFGRSIFDRRHRQIQRETAHKVKRNDLDGEIMKLGSRKRLVQSLSAMCHKFNQRTSKKRRATQLSDVIISFRAIIPFKISSFTPPRLIKISSNSRHEEKVNPSRIGKIELAPRGRRIGISFAQNPFLLSLERIVTKAVSSMVIPFPSFRSNFIGYKIFYESSVHLTLAIVSELNGKYRMKFHYNKIRPIIQRVTISFRHFRFL